MKPAGRGRRSGNVKSLKVARPLGVGGRRSVDPADPTKRPEPNLGSPVAQRILDLVRRRPGLTTRDVAAQLDLAWATVAYHQRRLEQEGLLSTTEQGRRLVLHAREGLDEPPMHALQALLQGQTMRRVALAVQAEPGLGEDALARHLGLPLRALRYHLERLAAAGLLEASDPLRREGLVPTPLLDLLLGEPAPEAAADDPLGRR